MVFLKYSALVSLIIFSVTGKSSTFSVTDCLNRNFDTEVSHKIKPFGLLKNILAVKKDKCVFTVKQEKYKYLKKQWTVDICREPIHIKYGVSAVDVFKRDGRCISSSDFCQSFSKLLKSIEDDGLIFAPGEREDLSSVHGQLHCSFLLIKSYLEDGVVYSRNKQYGAFRQREDYGVKPSVTSKPNDISDEVSESTESADTESTESIE